MVYFSQRFSLLQNTMKICFELIYIFSFLATTSYFSRRFSLGLKCIIKYQNHGVNQGAAIKTIPKQQKTYNLNANTMHANSKVIYRTHMYKHCVMHVFNSHLYLGMHAIMRRHVIKMPHQTAVSRLTKFRKNIFC